MKSRKITSGECDARLGVDAEYPDDPVNEFYKCDLSASKLIKSQLNARDSKESRAFFVLCERLARQVCHSQVDQNRKSWHRVHNIC